MHVEVNFLQRRKYLSGVYRVKICVHVSVETLYVGISRILFRSLGTYTTGAASSLQLCRLAWGFISRLGLVEELQYLWKVTSLRFCLSLPLA